MPIFPTGCIGPGSTPDERLSWIVALLPFLEQAPLYKQLDLSGGFAANEKWTDSTLSVAHCPSFAGPLTVSTYFGSAGIGRDAPFRLVGDSRNGFMGYDRPNSMGMIKDGTSQTIAVAESRWKLGPWARGGYATVRGFDPADLPIFGEQRPFGGHTNAFNVGMADGSVRAVNASIDPPKLAATITIAAGEAAETYLD